MFSPPLSLLPGLPSFHNLLGMDRLGLINSDGFALFSPFFLILIVASVSVAEVRRDLGLGWSFLFSTSFLLPTPTYKRALVTDDIQGREINLR